MKCPDVERLISAHLDGEVTASQWQQAEQHIAGCAVCARRQALFAAGTAFLRAALPPISAPENAWAGIAARLDAGRRPAPRLRRLQARWSVFMAAFHWPGRRWLPATVLATVLLISTAYFFWPRRAGSPPPSQPLVARGEAPAPRRQPPLAMNLAATGLPPELQSYLSNVGLLLMEVKALPAPPETDLRGYIRQSSRRLLDESILVKRELKGAKARTLENLIDDLEVVLLDMANLGDAMDRESYERLKAAILQQDLLIKIEIIDLKRIPSAARTGGPPAF